MEFKKRLDYHAKGPITLQCAAGPYLGAEFGISALEPSRTLQFLSKVRYCRTFDFSDIKDGAVLNKLGRFKHNLRYLKELELPEFLREPFGKLVKEGPYGPEDNYPADRVLVDAEAQLCIARNIELLLDCFENVDLMSFRNNWGKFSYLTYPAGVSFSFWREEGVFVLLANKELLAEQRSIGRLMYPESGSLFSMQEKYEAAFWKGIGRVEEELSIIGDNLLSCIINDSSELSARTVEVDKALMSIFRKLDIGYNQWYGRAFLLHVALRALYSRSASSAAEDKGQLHYNSSSAIKKEGNGLDNEQLLAENKAINRIRSFSKYTFLAEIDFSDLLNHIIDGFPFLKHNSIEYSGVNQRLKVYWKLDTAGIINYADRQLILEKGLEFMLRFLIGELLKNAHDENLSGVIRINLSEPTTGVFKLSVENQGNIDHFVLDELYSKIKKQADRKKLWRDKITGQLIVEILGIPEQGEYLKNNSHRFERLIDLERALKDIDNYVEMNGLVALFFVEGLGRSKNKKGEQGANGLGLTHVLNFAKAFLDGHVSIVNLVPNSTVVSLIFRADRIDASSPIISRDIFSGIPDDVASDSDEGVSCAAGLEKVLSPKGYLFLRQALC
ncbi:MAG: hypothetical protein HY761_02085 [Candidatus Omnitrophica bacterium]|nr:hypothetical protein [Candidatus Omnitrophota bacterium]